MNTLKGIPKTKEAGIYMIFNLDNKKTYIGATKNLHDRARKHAYDLKAKRHQSKEMQNDFSLGNRMRFVVLERVESNISNEEIRNREWLYMLAFDDKGYELYNKKESIKQIKKLLFYCFVKKEMHKIQRKLYEDMGIHLYGMRWSKAETVEQTLTQNL